MKSSGPFFFYMQQLVPELDKRINQSSVSSFADLPQDSDIRFLVRQIPIIAASAFNRVETTLNFAQKIVQLLYKADSNLGRETYVALLEKLCETALVAKEVTAWLVYADDEVNNRKSISYSSIVSNRHTYLSSFPFSFFFSIYSANITSQLPWPLSRAASSISVSKTYSWPSSLKTGDQRSSTSRRNLFVFVCWRIHHAQLVMISLIRLRLLIGLLHEGKPPKCEYFVIFWFSFIMKILTDCLAFILVFCCCLTRWGDAFKPQGGRLLGRMRMLRCEISSLYILRNGCAYISILRPTRRPNFNLSARYEIL